MFQTVVGVCFALAVIAMAGSAVLRLLARSDSIGALVERTALSWVLGAGYVSLATFFFGLAITGPGLQVAITVGALVLFLVARRVPEAVNAWIPLRPAEWIVVAALIWQACVIVWSSAHLVLGWDGLCTWETKARIAFAHGGVLPPEYFQDSTREWTHPRYPLGWPYLQGWLYLCIGKADQAWVRGLGALYYAAGAGLIAGAVSRLGGNRLFGLIMAACLFFIPALTADRYGHFSGYADLPMAVVFLAAAARLPVWHLEPRPADERIFAALGLLLIWTKSEGVILLAALLAIALLRCLKIGRWRRLILMALPAVGMLIVYAVYLRQMGAAPDTNYISPTPAHWLERAGRYGPIAARMGSEFIQWESWSTLWPATLVGLVCLVLHARQREAAMATLVLILPWPGLTLAYLLSTWSNYTQHIETSLSRLYLEFAPFSLVVIGLAASASLARKRAT